MPRPGLCCAVLLLLLAALSRPARALDVLFHADLDGRLAAPACGKGPTDGPAYVHLLATIAAASAKAPSLVLLGGNAIAPGLLARQILSAPGGEAVVRALFARAGYDALTLGHRDLSLDPALFDRYLAAVAGEQIPIVLSNLRCTGPAAGLCGRVRRELVLERGGERVAIIATLSPRVLPGLSPERRAGLALDEPLPVVRAAVKRLRAAGVARVLLMVQIPGSRAGVDEVISLEEQLGRGGDAPDVILAGGFGDRDDDTGALRLVRRDGAPPVVGSTAGGTTVAAVQIPSGAAAEERITVTTLPARVDAADPAAAALLAPHLARYCAEYGRVVGGGPVDGSIDREEWTRYVLAVLRRRTGAEIALLNRGFVKPGPFPLRGSVTLAELFRAMPYRGISGSGRITGAKLASLLAPALAKPGLVALGAEARGGSLTVNGRPLDPARHYRVATIGFVVEGGDELLPPDALPFAPLGAGVDLRDLVREHLATGTALEDGDPDVDAQHDFGRPAARRPLWVAMTDLSVDLSTTKIDRHASYTAPQLTRAEQRAVKGEATGLLQLRAPLHENDTRLRIVYGYARNQPAGKPASSAETADLVSATTLHNYRGLRDLSAPVPRAAVPDPYARLQLESELTRPPLPTANRAYRHAELTATAGAIFTLTPKLRVRGGPGLRRQLLADGPAGRTRFLAEAGLSLDPVAIATLGPLSARLEGLVDYVFIDPAGAREHQLRASSKLALPLLPHLFLTAGVDVFGVQQSRQGWGTAYDTTLGLRVHLDAAHQSL